MRRLPSAISFLIPCLVLAQAGCSREQPPKVERPTVLVAGPKDTDKKDEPAPKPPTTTDEPVKKADPIKEDKTDPPLKEPDPAPAAKDSDEKYEAALTEALNYLADNEPGKALVALETAKRFQDTEFVRGEITRVKQRLETTTTARKTADEIETILDEGKAADAAKLAREALKEYGDSDAAAKLAQLRLRAEALEAAAAKEDAAARYQRFRIEGDAALKEKNLRAAALAYEQALTAKDDPVLQKQMDALREDLSKFDMLRTRAAEQRRDPRLLEDALESLKQAAALWDTLQLRQDLDEVSVALSKRRDNVSVADFDIQGDVGIPAAGKAIAEELLPTLKPRFDLVERGQLQKVLNELKLEASLDDSPEEQKTLSDLAKVRYLVLGSVRRLGGLTVNARLVDVKTGLVVQTAKITAPNPEALLAQIGDLGKQLLMDDEEKLAYEQTMVKAARVQLPPAEDAELPPPPPVPVAEAPLPPPVVPFTPVPPDFGGLKLNAFDALPPPPPADQPLPAFAPAGAAEVRVKNRLLHAVLELGDNLFQRGQHQDAQRQFAFALNLAPGNFDIRLRLGRVEPFLPPPPPPPVVIVPRPVLVAKPRIAVLNFVVSGNPRITPPFLSSRTPEQLIPYLLPHYHVVDPGEVHWYMARMGLTVRDLMEDPDARRWLGRALNVRYFLLGTIQETASFNVEVFLIDAEFGFLQNRVRLHVRNVPELRFRLAELAQLLQMQGPQRVRYLNDEERFDLLMVKGRNHLDRGELVLAVATFEDALRLRPGNVAARSHLERSRHLLWVARLEEERRQQLLAEQAQAEAARRRQWDIFLRSKEIQRQGLLGPIQVDPRHRQAAQVQLVEQARVAIKVGNFELAIGRFQGALALAPKDDIVLRELAQARAEAERRAQLRVAQEAAVREAALNKQRALELFQAKQKLEEDQRQAQALLAAQRKAQFDRDQAAYKAAVDEGQRLLAKGNFDAALAVLQTARRVKQTDAVDALINHAMVEQARLTAQKQGEAQRLELERKLTAERQRRKQAEDEAKKNRDLYEKALDLAQKALDQKNFTVAQTRFQEAGKLFQTDAVLTGLQKVRAAQDKTQADAKAAQQRAVEEKTKAERIQTLLTDAKTALDAGQFAKAQDLYRQARKIDPGNLEALGGLTRADQGQQKALADARKKSDDSNRAADFSRLVKTGQANLNAKQYSAAIIALTEALKLRPDDPAAKIALQTAEKAQAALGADAKMKDELKKKTDAYQKLLNDGRQALDAKRFDQAILAFQQAQKLLPGDKSSTDFLEQAQSGKKAAADAVALEAKNRAEAIQKAQELKKTLDAGRVALAGKKLAEAANLLERAALLDPKNADVQRALVDLRQAEKQAQGEAVALKQRQEKYVQLLGQAQKAYQANQFASALKTLAEVENLMPGDKAGRDLLRQVQDAQAKAQTLEIGAKKLVAYQQALTLGQQALLKKQYDQAVKSFAEAAKLQPDDQKAQQLLLQAQKAWDSAKLDTADAAKKQAAYQQALNQGQQALLKMQYQAAVQAFSDAAKLMPGDQKTQLLLQQAQKALDAASAKKDPDPMKKPPVKDDKVKTIKDKEAKGPDDKAKLQNLLDQGAVQDKQEKFADAMKTYQAALDLSPNDPRAKNGLKKAEFSFRIAEAERHLAAMRAADAIRELELALKISPGNPTALKLLLKAKKK